MKNLASKKPKLDDNRAAAAEQAIHKAAAAEDREDGNEGGGKAKREKGKKPGGRGKSSVHRQQHYQKALKSGKPGKRAGAHGGGKKSGKGRR